MQFSLQTGFGDSKEYAGLTNSKKMQGLCQVNGAAQAKWTITSITMIQAHRRKGAWSTSGLLYNQDSQR